MIVQFFSEDIEMPDFNQQEIATWVQNVIETKKMQCGKICVIFCSDKYLLKVNQDYLKHDYYTDIITFDYCEDNIISGDIFISTQRVAENAEKYNTSKTELFRVIIHGVLHLLGFNDATDEEKEIMRKKEDQCIEALKQ